MPNISATTISATALSASSLSAQKLGASGAVGPYLLLDEPALDYQKISLAYSISRRLRADYSGYAAIIRRPSDEADLNAGWVGDELDTDSILAHVGEENGWLKRWHDQAANGFWLEQGTQTVLVSAGGTMFTGANNKPVVDFPGTAHDLDRSISLFDCTGADEFSLFMVYKQDSTQGVNQAFLLTQGGASQNYASVYATYSDNIIYFDHGGATGGRLTVAQPSGWDDVYHVFEVHRDGTSMSIVVDGVELATRNDVATAMSNVSGMLYAGKGTPSGQIKGGIHEIVTAKVATTTAERAAVRQNMAAYYAITLS